MSDSGEFEIKTVSSDLKPVDDGIISCESLINCQTYDLRIFVVLKESRRFLCKLKKVPPPKKKKMSKGKQQIPTQGCCYYGIYTNQML